MNVEKLGLGSFHTVYLEPFTGLGALVMPHPSADVWFGPESLHGAALASALRTLLTMGWELLEGDDGGMCDDSPTDDGCRVVGIVAEPIGSDDDLSQLAAAGAAIRQAMCGPVPQIT